MKDAFRVYRKFAWGYDTLHYTKGRWVGVNDLGGLRVTMVDSLDTLYLMGLKKEFDDVIRYLMENGLFGENQKGRTQISVFEINIRVLGGLLSAYDLSGNKGVLKLAEQLAQILMCAFTTPSGVPDARIRLNCAYKDNITRAGGRTNLAEIGTLHLEWAMLSARTGNPMYQNCTNRVMSVISDIVRRGKTHAPEGLFVPTFDAKSGEFLRDNGAATFGPRCDSFYEYLIKCWRSLEDLEDTEMWRSMFDDAITGMKKNLLKKYYKAKSSEVYEYVSEGEVEKGSNHHILHHLSCFVPGMLVLGAAEAPMPKLAEEYIETAKNIVRTCVEMYTSTPTGLSGTTAIISESEMVPGRRENKQQPETLESLFYLYRKTGEEIYREQAWTIFQSMKQHYGQHNWGGIKDVYQSNPSDTTGEQYSWFFAETLKYLYLIFSDGNVIHLDEWVLNTEAHPFKIMKFPPL